MTILAEKARDERCWKEAAALLTAGLQSTVAPGGILTKGQLEQRVSLEAVISSDRFCRKADDPLVSSLLPLRYLLDIWVGMTHAIYDLPELETCKLSSPWQPEPTATPSSNVYNESYCVPFSFQPVSNADFIVPVEIDGTIHQVSNSCVFSFSNFSPLLCSYVYECTSSKRLAEVKRAPRFSTCSHGSQHLK